MQPTSHSSSSYPTAKHPRRVLILVENLSVPFDRRVWNEARSLTRAGHRVHVICPRMIDRQPKEVLQGVTIHRYPLPLLKTNSALGYLWEYPWATIMTLLYSARIFVKDGFDVIHACNPPDLFFFLGWIFRPFGVRFVYDQHDLCPEVFKSRFGQSHGMLFRMLQWLEKKTYARADVVISTNESYRQTAIDRGSCDPEKVFVVRSAPDLREFKPEAPDPTLKGGRDHLVCYLGTMAPQDGVDYLVRSIAHVAHDFGRDDIRFALVGDGDSRRELQQLAQELGVDDRIVFTGRVPDDELRRWLSSADACVAPDPVNPLNDVSTMNKILEYMAMEKPIVSYGLVETRRSAGQAAVYARANDPMDFAREIVALLDDVPRRTHMGRVGRQRLVDRLSWQQSAQRLVEAYDSI